MARRRSGVLLHVTSLPSRYGIGDLGPGAYRFVDFLKETGQHYWQILPLNPTSVFLGNSPYSSHCVFAGNPLLISPDILLKEGFLLKSDFKDSPVFPEGRVDYPAVTQFKKKILQRAYGRFRIKGIQHREFQLFCRRHRRWLDDFALFVSLKDRFSGLSWDRWPQDIKDRKPVSLSQYRKTFKDNIVKEKFLQYLFFRQWRALKKYCNDEKIKIIGDVPIYVSYDSADVWTHSYLFKLDKNKRPQFLAGVPPDYFSSTGQLWGNPVYRWQTLKKSGYRWWLKRLKENLKNFDMVRLDHFRGFVAYWQVPKGHKTAIGGRWVKAPVYDFFNVVLKRFLKSSIIVEDLGIITQDVKEVIKEYGFRGMKVLLFAFSDDSLTSSYLPHNYDRNCVVYTGTHDNNTVRGWFEKEATPEIKARVFDYLGKTVSSRKIPQELMRLAMESLADIAIFPMQDVLGLGQKARMNRPATSHKNWQWRLLPGQINSKTVRRLRVLTESCGR